MAEIELTKMSSKGQIVIPSNFRKEYKEGEKFVIIKAGKQLIFKRVKDFDENIIKDLEFAQKTEEAWESYARGEFVSTTAGKFLKDLENAKD